MFINSQMFVLATTTTLLVTIRLCNAEPQAIITFLSDSPTVTEVTRGEYHQLDGNAYDKSWTKKTDQISAPEQVRYETAETMLSPTIFYPLFVRLSIQGETVEMQQQQNSPLSEPGKPQRFQHYEHGATMAAAAAAAAADTHVIAHAEENSTSSVTNANPSGPETHDKQITGNNSNSGQIDNSIAVEYLPTIAVPFLDSIAHGIIGEIQQHVQLIKPGTKWCGDGNKARSYEDVGVLYKTDKCCRNHDKCPYYILSHETKYGLHNDAHFTRSHCDCDESFYDCLKKVNSPFSTGVGIMYFNILKMKCFRLEHPVIMCSQTAGWISKHCVEYIVDVRQKQKWQWFDNHEF